MRETVTPDLDLPPRTDAERESRIAWLTEQIEARQEEARDAQRQAALMREEIDALHRSARPTYPTASHREALAAAVAAWRARAIPSTHHGDPAIPNQYDVVVNGARGWINVRARAPYSQANRGYRLWVFSDSEIEGILDEVRQALAATGDGRGHVANHWLADDSISIALCDRPNCDYDPNGEEPHR